MTTPDQIKNFKTDISHLQHELKPLNKKTPEQGFHNSTLRKILNSEIKKKEKKIYNLNHNKSIYTNGGKNKSRNNRKNKSRNNKKNKSRNNKSRNNRKNKKSRKN